MKRTWPLHPILFAVWTVLFIYAHNIQFVSFTQVWTPILVLLGLVLVLFMPFFLILRNMAKAAALTSLLLVLFFSFTHIRNLLWETDIGYFATTRSLTLLLGYVVFFLIVTALVLRLKAGWREITQTLNIIALTLLLLAGFNIVKYQASAVGSRQTSGISPYSIAYAGPVAEEELPDIYYIILDSYARADILQEVFGYDNSEFLGFLREKGFYVAEQSRSNYAQTDLSLSSSLNASHLDDLAAQVGTNSNDRHALYGLIQHNAVMQILEQYGYDIVALPSGYSATNLRDSDQYLASSRTLNELEVWLLCSTPLPWLSFEEQVFDPFEVHRQNVLYSLDHLPDTIGLPSPRFVFAHVVSPHAPFVFDAQGNAVNPEQQFDLRAAPDQPGQVGADYRQSYIAQLIFVNQRMMDIIDQIAAGATRPTIIIVQADHGTDYLIDWDHPESSYLKEKHAILNAYLLPGDGAQFLYDDITPVNTFRLVLTHYLGVDLPLLEDRSYFSNWTRPYDFLDVTEEVISGHRP